MNTRKTGHRIGKGIHPYRRLPPRTELVRAATKEPALFPPPEAPKRKLVKQPQAPQEQRSLTRDELHHITEDLLRNCNDPDQLLFLTGFIIGRLGKVRKELNLPPLDIPISP